jgi:putative membrane protein
MKEFKDFDEQLLQSRERTHLANERNRLAAERTFLAWIRTGLTGLACGLGITQFLTFHSPSHQLLSKVIGTIFVILGIAMFILAFIDFKKSFDESRVKKSLASSLAAVSVLTFTLTTISLVLVWLIWQKFPL